MKALAGYIHSRGLKFGIYSDVGYQTCGGRPGSRGHEFQDAITYARWGVDYLKYDWCNSENINAIGAYTTMHDALVAAGRPVVFSLCEWGQNKPWLWAKGIGNLWRTTGDIYHCFDCEKKYATWSAWGVMRTVFMERNLRKYAGPGHWNDPDMLEVGNGMTQSGDRAHFSLWCMVAAPLIAGNDLRSMSDQSGDILTNAGAIAIDQDSLGIQGFLYSNVDSLEVWVKPLVHGDWAMCFLNRSVSSRKIHFNWESTIITDTIFHKQLRFDRGDYRLWNVWDHRNMGNTSKPLNFSLVGHDAVLLRLSP